MATMKKPLTLHLLRGAWTATLITALAVILKSGPVMLPSSFVVWQRHSLISPG